MTWIIGTVIFCFLILGFLILTKDKKKLRNDGDISDIAWRFAVKQAAAKAEKEKIRKTVVPDSHTGSLAKGGE